MRHFAVLLILCWNAGSKAQSVPEPAPELSPWDNSFNVRLWSGYKDNVLLGNEFEVGSPLVGGGLDALFFRVPVDGTEFHLFATGDYTRFLDARGTDKEVTAITQAQFRKQLGKAWKIGLRAEYLFFDQVLDASAIYREFGTLQVLGHSAGLSPSLRRSIMEKYWLELELEGTRQEFGGLLDDFWEGGPKLILGRAYGFRSEWTVSYELHRRAYDTRVARDAAGGPLLGTGLEMDQHELAAEVRHSWDQKRRWRTVSKVAIEFNDDNGRGYYDYIRYSLVQQLRYQAERWETRADLRLYYYDYDVQTVSALDLSRRHKLGLTVGIRGERRITDAIKLFANYEHERSLSNVAADEYKVNLIRAGMDWEF